MLTIGAKQLAAIEDAVFQERLGRVLGKHFPERKTALGANFSRMVAAGIERARGHGFEAPEDISKYVMLEFALHPGFDQDPSLAWAAELLAAPDIPTPAMRMQLLFDRALDSLRPDAGLMPSDV